MSHIIDDESLSKALDALGQQDGDFARALEEVGPPPLRNRPHGFPTLLRIIVAQQVSLASAQAIWDRLEAACQPLEPASLLALGEEGLRTVGFSRQKICYGMSLAELFESGALEPTLLDSLEDEDAIARLTEVKGIGRWSAEVYLLFAMGRPDVFPADDLGLMMGAERLKRLNERPSAKALRAMAEDWRPWRAAAARMLWHYRQKAALPEDAD